MLYGAEEMRGRLEDKSLAECATHEETGRKLTWTLQTKRMMPLPRERIQIGLHSIT